MKIYTKTGDQGETGLLGGKRVSKSHSCIQVCGELDELNSWIGVIKCQMTGTSDIEESMERLAKVQDDLFRLGAAVAACLGESKKDCRVHPSRIGELESWIDDLDQQLPPLTAFVLPGGDPVACWVHLSRSVCRRAERALVELMSAHELVLDLSQEQVYLNRLSDLLFMLARKMNVVAEHPETHWVP